MPNEVDLLMDLDPLELSAQNIDSIITYHRKMRQNHEAGVKPKKESGPKQKIDLAEIGLEKAPAVMNRRKI